MSQRGGILPVSNGLSTGVLKGLSAFNKARDVYKMRKMQNQVERLYRAQTGRGGRRRLLPVLHQRGTGRRKEYLRENIAQVVSEKGQQGYQDWVERPSQHGRGRSRFTRSQSGGSLSARDNYNLGGKSRIVVDEMGRENNDGSWLARYRQTNVAPRPGNFHGTTDVPYCVISGRFNCMLRHFHQYGFPPGSNSL